MSDTNNTDSEPIRDVPRPIQSPVAGHWLTKAEQFIRTLLMDYDQIFTVQVATGRVLSPGTARDLAVRITGNPTVRMLLAAADSAEARAGLVWGPGRPMPYPGDPERLAPLMFEHPPPKVRPSSAVPTFDQALAEWEAQPADTRGLRPQPALSTLEMATWLKTAHELADDLENMVAGRGAHAEHTQRQVGPCVHCSCGKYANARLPKKPKAKPESDN